MRKTAPYFTDSELRCKCGKCTEVNLDPTFDIVLAELRKEFGRPMKANSCCRCAAHNAKVGGKPKSFHISDHPAWVGVKGTAAIDIAYPTADYKEKLARLAWRKGWRIGFNHTFLHLDAGHILKVTPQVIFKYDHVTDKELQDFINTTTKE